MLPANSFFFLLAVSFFALLCALNVPWWRRAFHRPWRCSRVQVCLREKESRRWPPEKKKQSEQSQRELGRKENERRDICTKPKDALKKLVLASLSLSRERERETAPCPLAARGSSPRPPLRQQQQHGRRLALRRRHPHRLGPRREEARRRRVLRVLRLCRFRPFRRRRRPGRARPFPRAPRSPSPLRLNRAPLAPSKHFPVQARLGE